MAPPPPPPNDPKDEHDGCAWRDYAHRLEAYMLEQQTKNDAKFAELEAKNEALTRAFERRSEQRAKMPPPPKPPRTKEEVAEHRRQQDQLRADNIVTTEETIPVPPELKKCCLCGGENFRSVGIGKPSVTWSFVPAHFRKHVHMRETVACRCGGHVITAPAPERWSIGVLFLICTACSKKTEATPTPTTTAAATQAAAALDASSAPEPKVPRSYRYTVSGATFTKDMLDECVDFTIELSQEPDGGADALFSKFTKNWKKDKVTQISKPCAEQFATKTVLGSCDFSGPIPNDGGVTATMHVHSARYRFEDVGLSDAVMKECLEEKGTWNVLDPKSSEWLAAKREHTRRKLHRAADKLTDDSE